jgi:hypothetical protein
MYAIHHEDERTLRNQSLHMRSMLQSVPVVHGETGNNTHGGGAT